MDQTSLALGQLTAPLSSPDLSLSRSFVTLSDTQELAKVVTDIQMASTHAPRYTCSYTPPKDLLEATLTDLYLLTPCPLFATNQLLAPIMTTKHVQ